MVEDDDAVGEAHDHPEDVLDDHDGHAALLDAADDLDGRRHLARVEARHHFVEEQEPGAERERLGDLEALARRERQRGSGRVGERLHAEQGKHLERAGLGVLRPPVAQERADHHVLEDGQPREGPHHLEGAGDAKPRQREGGKARHIAAEERDAPAGRAQVARDQVEERRLPRAVGTDEAEDLALGYVEADVLHGEDTAEVLPQRADGERDGHGILRSKSWRRPERPSGE